MPRSRSKQQKDRRNGLCPSGGISRPATDEPRENTGGIVKIYYEIQGRPGRYELDIGDTPDLADESICREIVRLAKKDYGWEGSLSAGDFPLVFVFYRVPEDTLHLFPGELFEDLSVDLL